MLPNFLLVGAPKAGTTSLNNYLDQLPTICGSPEDANCRFNPASLCAADGRSESCSADMCPKCDRAVRQSAG